MAMTASLKEMVRPVSIPPPFDRSCGAFMQVSFGRPSSHTTKKLDRVRRDASIHRAAEKRYSRKPLCSFDYYGQTPSSLPSNRLFWFFARRQELPAVPVDRFVREGDSQVPGPGGIVVPLRIRHEGAELSFFSIVATFGTPLDVTVAELVIESSFPANPETASVLRQHG